MAVRLDDAAGLEHLASALAAAARRLAARGHCAATSSNFSARLDGGHALVSRSGLDKLEIGPGDFLVVDAAGQVVGGTGTPDPAARASAETRLHLAIYALRDPGAVIHTHPVSAAVISRAHAAAGEVRLAGWEMLKALAGVTTHEHEERVPVVDNGQDMEVVAAAVRARLVGRPDAHAVLLAGHGLYTWGASVAEAVRHAEALDHLFECELRAR